jgi:DNA ligase-1
MATTLYQLDTNGNVKIWKISVNQFPYRSEIVIESGRKDSENLVKNVSQVTSGKNEGKANETNHYTQALAEMESTIKTQLKKGYVYDLKDVKSSSILGSGIPAPMLAHKYCKDGSQSSSKTLSQLGLVGKEIIVQPKLDGNRCMIKVENGKAVMHTRKGDIMPVQLSHIIADVEGMMLNGLVNIDGNFILDGELFSSEISFNTLNGLVKRLKATLEEIEKRKFIKFHLYDVMLSDGYEIRNNFIQKFSSENIVIVPSIKIVATEDNIQKYLERFLANGHEGLMIRQLGQGYDNKRSWQLLKVKVFEDSEFELIGFEEDVRGGFVGAFVMRDENDNVWNAGASGQSVEERTEMWNNQSKYIGKMATVCFFGKSEYDIPRFPKFKGIAE